MIRYTKEYIETLLDKYMDGKSTLEEEDILSEYFRGQDIPKEWVDYQQLFQEIEAMKPHPKIRKRWIGWGVAAAVAVLFVSLVWQYMGQYDMEQTPAELTARVDSVSSSHIEQQVDTTTIQKEHCKPTQTKKRSLRKSEPTMTDIDKTYALIAEAEQEVIEAQLAAYGYIPVMQEDGTIIYIHEQTELLSYEE